MLDWAQKPDGSSLTLLQVRTPEFKPSPSLRLLSSRGLQGVPLVYFVILNFVCMHLKTLFCKGLHRLHQMSKGAQGPRKVRSLCCSWSPWRGWALPPFQALHIEMSTQHQPFHFHIPFQLVFLMILFLASSSLFIFPPPFLTPEDKGLLLWLLGWCNG